MYSRFVGKADCLYMLITVAKPEMINVRLSQTEHDEFKIAAELRGSTMSSLLRQFIVRVIREEKEYSPRAFEGRNNSSGMLTAEITTKAPKQKRNTG